MAADYVGYPTVLVGSAMNLERESVGNAVERSEYVPGKICLSHDIPLAYGATVNVHYEIRAADAVDLRIADFHRSGGYHNLWVVVRTPPPI